MENLDEALATLINTALSGIDTSVNFLQAELPEVIVQLLMWHGVRNGIISLLGFIGLGLTVYFGYKILIPQWEKLKKDDLEGLTLLYSIPIVVVAVISFFHINLTWLQIWIAPKVWLLEYAANLVK